MTITATPSMTRQPCPGGTTLSFAGPAASLPESYRAELRRGFDTAAAAIGDARPGEAVHVEVTEVSFSLCDFQVDGLSVAMRRWLEAEFDLPPLRIDVTFDRDANRYVFDWLGH